MQFEWTTMVAVQILGDDAAIAFDGSQRKLELNALQPVIIHNVLRRGRAARRRVPFLYGSLCRRVELDTERTEQNVKNSLMLVTALGPKISYDKAREIAHWAHHERLSLREATLKLDYLAEGQVDKRVRLEKMAHPQRNVLIRHSPEFISDHSIRNSYSSKNFMLA
jgi:fumarate hydratase class II